MPKNLYNIKHEIIQTTREMILEQGYDKLNIRDIAKRCGIATGTFYNYFRSKQEIISSLLDSDWKTTIGYIRTKRDPGKTPVDQLEVMFKGLKKMVGDVHSIWAAGFPDDLEAGTLDKLSAIKTDLRKELSLYIREIITGHVVSEQEEFTADFIARVLFSYSYQADSGFEPLRLIFNKIIK
jgi:AcrR family transcriptional regulator